jgi:membrane carboxypeptidase/penicillin-binding protein
VLSRLQEDGVTSEPAGRGLPTLPIMVAFERPRREIGFHFVDQVAREAKGLAGIEAITANSYTVRSTISPPLQRAVEEALQEGLWRYERSTNRLTFRGAEANLSQALKRIEAGRAAGEKRPAWQVALAQARLPLYDVHWTSAIIVEKPGGKKNESWKVGLADGRVLPLSLDVAPQRKLALNDVVFVRVTDGTSNNKGKSSARAELRVRPTVQGSIVVLENKTGRILAMAGGFSYPLSQLNRATQAVRQPGSAIKPLTYLAALGRGLQPNTLVSDDPITLPPIGNGRVRDRDYWTPKNYDGGAGGILTLRRALEYSRNLATVHLLEGGVADSPETSLDRLCGLAMEAQIYQECVRYYPFVLGAQPVRAVDLAAFYAAVANEGVRPTPHVIDSIERNGLVIYRHDTKGDARIGSIDRVAFYQLKTMMQGVLARGTARSIAYMSPYVAGKTGTSDNENDAWFVGFTNDVTVAVWLGYDNAAGKRRTLGGGATGGHVAVPIFEPVMQAVWAQFAPKTALAPPSPEAKRYLSCRAEAEMGQMQAPVRQAMTECFRIDASGQIVDTQYQLVSRDDFYIARETGGYYGISPNPNPFGYSPGYDPRQQYYNPGYGQSYGQGYYDQYGRWYQRDTGRPQAPVQAAPRDYYGRRIDPNYWGNRWRYY